MFRILMIIGAGGFLGSICRYLTATYMSRQHATLFPLGTFVANVAGCLLIGIFYALAEKGDVLSPEWRIFLTTGFCGGYTTFSTFAYENINLLQGQEFLYFALNLTGSVVAGLAATFIGMLIIKSMYA